MASEEYVPAVIPPDPARDRRRAAWSRAEVARAGRALDRLLAETCQCRYGMADGWGHSECISSYEE